MQACSRPRRQNTSSRGVKGAYILITLIPPSDTTQGPERMKRVLNFGGSEMPNLMLKSGKEAGRTRHLSCFYYINHTSGISMSQLQYIDPG